MADEDTDRKSPLAQVRETWRGLPAPRRRVVLGAGAAVLAGLGWLVYQGATAPDWVPVARGMLPEDQQVAVDGLTEAQIPYKLSEGGTILVPEEQLHAARMQLATSVLPSGRSVGFELFDESELGRSTFHEKVNYHRALEGELARTIRQVAAIEKARVHLVLPERRLFEEDQAEPSASVVVTLKRGAELDRRQVQAIRQLVAGAVERLPPGRVAVVDQSGTMLARPDDETMVTEEALEHRARFERTLERRVVELLEPLVGRGRVRAQVAAEMDFSRLVETEEKYDPESQVIRSEREKTEKEETERNVAAGPPGTASNLPDRAEATNVPGPLPAKSERSDHIKNYEVDRQTLRRETPHARVKRLSVAVLLDAPEGKAPPAAELASFERLVSSAVGLDPARGDAVEVAALPWSGFPEEEPVAEPVGPFESPVVLWSLVGALVLLFALVLLVLWLRARKRRRLEAEEAVRREEEELREALEAAEREVLPEPPPEARVLQERIAALRERARMQGQDDIRRTASVVGRWLRERDAQGQEKAA